VVEVVYSYANFGRDTIDFLVSKGVKGIVLAGVGDGNSTDTRSPRCGGGQEGCRRCAFHTWAALIVRMEVNDDKLGFITRWSSIPRKHASAHACLMKPTTPRSAGYFHEY